MVETLKVFWGNSGIALVEEPLSGMLEALGSMPGTDKSYSIVIIVVVFRQSLR